MATARVPLASPIESRTNSTAKDARLVNGVIESKSGNKQIVKRAGTLSLTLSPTISSGVGQGLMYWNDYIIAAINNNIYTISGETTSSLLGTIVGTSVPLSFVSTANDNKLAFHNGANLYTINKGTPPTFVGGVGLSGVVSSVNITNGGGYYGENVSCTITVGATTTVTKTGHGLVAGQGVTFIGTLPTGMSVGTTYQVVYVDANSFTINDVSTGGGTGTPVATSGTSSGVSYQASPTVTFSASPGTTAKGTAFLFNHQVSEVIVTVVGAGYTSTPTITFSAPITGVAAVFASATLVVPGTTVYPTSAGSGYLSNTSSTITFSPPVDIVGSPYTGYLNINSTGNVVSLVYTHGVSGAGSVTPILSTPTSITATGTVVMASSSIAGPFAYGIEYLDGYCFVMKTDGSIYQSALENPASWDAANVIKAESDPDNANALFRHLNYLVAFGDWSIDVFYNAGNTTGSILNVNKSAKMEIGCAAGTSVAKAEQTLLWMGQSKTEGRGIYLLDGLSPNKVSTRYIDKYLNASNLSEVYSCCFKMAGHTLYLLTLVDQDITLVYDLEEKEWYQWTSYNGSAETYFKTSLYVGNVKKQMAYYFQNTVTGALVKMSTNYYSDDSSAIYFRSVTPILDSGTTKRKFFRRVEVIGDKIAATAYIRHTSDDYQTWSSYRTVNLIDTRPILYQNGSSRRRAYEYLLTDNVPNRVDSLELEFDIGGQE